MTPGLSVVRAAAGCGKTTELAARYLDALARGVPARSAVAITFTRRAAAELVQRVATALAACLDDERGAAARARLGAVWDEVYRPVCPADPAVARRALAALPEAPIGTTDTFVTRLLSEFALDAALPLPDGTAVPLDVPFGVGGGTTRALVRAARRVLDPPGDAPPRAEVARLVGAFTLDELVPQLAARGRWDHLRLAATEDVLGPWAAELGRILWKLPFAAVVQPTDPTDADAWAAALAAFTNEAGQWAVRDVARWAAAGCAPAATPYATFGWLAAIHLGRAPSKRLRAAIEGVEVPLGPGTLDLWAFVHALRFPYDDPAKVALADELRQARAALRGEVVSRGLRDAALAGELGYDELLEAAVHLCRHPPAGLVGRFRTLLVDEIQDANPGQHRLYEALAALEGTEAVFVGDARQSIYLFRDAEPELLRALEETRADPRELRVNRRSTPRLVEAHRALFDALDGPMRARRWRPIAALATLEADPANARLALDPAHHPDPEPVHVVVPDDTDAPKDDDLDARALEQFLERVRAAWTEPGHADDTAVVLAPSWGVAERACRWLRARTGRADAAFVEGSVGREGASRVSDDVRLFLRALASDDDDVAWLGVWRHPAVGLTDAALARGVAGEGLLRTDATGRRVPWRPGQRSRLAWWLSAEALGAPHDERDVAAFARARPALLAARDALGRRPTAEVLDRLLDALDVRTIYAAGPGGLDDVAELDVLLDAVRERDGRGLSAEAILVELDDDATERPQVRVERPAGHVACTTLFQAKGLAWDHVCVLRPGHLVRGRMDGEVREGWVEVAGQRLRLEGLAFDPDGGLSTFKDPLGRLAARLHHLRATEECARFVYVAVTRARRSVTLALPRKARPPKAREEWQLKDLLPGAWVGAPLPGVSIVARPPAPEASAPSTGLAVPTDRPAPPRVPPPAGWDERAPSSLGAWLSTEERAQFAGAVAAQVRLQNGWFRGGDPVHAPGTDPATGRGLAGHPLGHLTPADWGTLAHGWFAAWGFRGAPDRALVDAYLAAEWPGGAHPELAGWLLAVSARLASVGGPLWDRVTDPSAKLRFEHPLLGVARLSGREVSLAGRMDLLVEGPRGRCVVVDFKAGPKVPTALADLEEGASLRTYAFQLHAYAEALRRLGRTVDLVGLWFVRTGAQVTWG